MTTPTDTAINEFLAGYERRKGILFSELPFDEVRRLINWANSFDTDVANVIRAAFVRCQAGTIDPRGKDSDCFMVTA